MAGDWLKFEKATTDKPEVFAIASTLGIDPDAVVGKLVRLWSWFDSHTVDGNATSVTFALLDRITCLPGFAAAVAEQGWLLIKDGVASLPNFDRHNGETAKSRAQTAQRVAKHKGKPDANAKGNAVSVSSTVTSPLPREEKRREEKSNSSLPPAVEIPTWFPQSSEQAINCCNFPVHPDFVTEVWNQAMGRDFSDGSGQQIRRFANHIAARWSRERLKWETDRQKSQKQSNTAAPTHTIL